MDAELKRELTRIYNAIADIRKSQFRETWVTASALCRITGWDSNMLLMMRRNGVVKEKKQGKAVRYLVESIPQVAIQKKVENQML